MFNDTLEDVHVVAGQTAVLPCFARYKGEHKIIWMNPQRILFSNEKIIVIDDRRISVESSPEGDWNLKIKHVQHNDSGEYLCQINTSPVKIKRVKLHVQVPAHILNRGSSRDTDIKEGHDLSLSCKATGIPRPNITWFMKPLEAMETKEYLNVIGETLQVRNIQRYQSGHYVCMAYNNVPPAVTREMLVQVQYVPIVKLLNTRLGQTRGKETILECSVTSYPRANIRWIKNGVKIIHSFKHRLELYPRKHNTYTLTLQIVYINHDDYGEYVCEAENLLGSQRASMVLYEYHEPTTRTEALTTPIPRTTTFDRDFYERVMNHHNKKDNDRQYVLSDGSRSGYDYNEYDYNRDRTDYLKNSKGSGLELTPNVACVFAALLLNIVSLISL
ncbi:Hemicentin 2 [Mactra antiquata]